MFDSKRTPIPRKCADHSTAEGFSFSFYCDRCGKEWRSVPYEFNREGIAAPIEPLVYQMLWNDQHEAALERASREGALAFNRCPGCGRSVCGECFYLSETVVSDICKDCL